MNKILFFAVLMCSIGIVSAEGSEMSDKTFEYIGTLLSVLVAVAYFGVAVMAWLWYRDITEKLLKFLAMGFTLCLLGVVLIAVILLGSGDPKILIFYVIQLAAALYFLAGMWLFMKSAK